jgi:putative endonuclease
MACGLLRILGPVKKPTKKPRQAPWYVYMLDCAGGRIYTGVTPDLAARFDKHRSGKGGAFTRSFRPRKILAAMRCASRGAALSAEHALKQLERSEKLAWARLYEWVPTPPKAARGTRRSKRSGRAQNRSS